MNPRVFSIIQIALESTMATGVGVESAPLGIKHRELEYTFYGKLRDVRDLDKLTKKKEAQEQWLVPITTDKKGKLRIRQIDGKLSIATVKFKRVGLKGSEEIECEISDDFFNALKEIGVGGYKKIRYFIPADNGLTWEIDTFLNQHGVMSEWVKIDLEVPSESTTIPNHFPFALDEKIEHQGPDLTPEERDKIDWLWKTEWAQIDPTRSQ